ncbi:unnamed protein product, partial [Mesorhabditis spiculigera]
MSALTRFVSNTFTDLSHKRQSKRLVHDESISSDLNSAAADINPNFNFFDPAEHFGEETWQGTSASQQKPLEKREEKKEEKKGKDTTQVPFPVTVTEVSSGRRVLPLKNMVKKLTPFNNNSKEVKDKNSADEKPATDRSDEEARKNEKKGMWKLKEQIERRKNGDKQMLIDLDDNSY